MEQERELQEISGTIESVIFKNEENGYTILTLKDENDEIQTVLGCFPFAAKGESIQAYGTWVTHNVHGKQFKAEYSQRYLPSSTDAIYEYLSGRAIKGVGPATASLIVDKFGEKSLDIIETSPEKLSTVRGISREKAEQISKNFKSQLGIRRVVEFVCSYGLRPILAMRMYKFYGDNALGYIKDNPYILAASHIGGSFSDADALALQLGMEGDSINRIKAAANFELVHNSGNGHCFLPKEKLAAATAQLISVNIEQVNTGIDELIEEKQIIFEQIAGCNACYQPELYNAETQTATRIADMSRHKYKIGADFADMIEDLETKLDIKYSQQQISTLNLALNNQIVVLTGGPGTGKTTSIRAILAMFDILGIKTVLTAPTGRAAKRMSELTGREATTIHRLLGAKFAPDGERSVFTKNEKDKLDCAAVILDESSMVDIMLMDALLRAMPEDARLVMVGDADQLPSVGPGNVFSAIIRSGVVPVVKLTQIFRQNGGSRIVRNAHMIINGEFPNLGENAGDFFRLRRLQAGSAVDTIAELCATRLPGKMHIPPNDIQVLSPTRRGEMGTANLNKCLQSVLNPPAKDKKEKAFGDVIFREGDRVMQIRNNYDILWSDDEKKSFGSGIYNGDIGQIISINASTEVVSVRFDEKIAEYPFEILNELEHAWAITVHKSQGSEYRAVVMSLSQGSQMLMTRSLLYTAVTRAKELLILVGDDNTVFQMIKNDKQSNRYNALRVRIRKLCGAE